MISGLSTEMNICLEKHRTTGVQDKPPTISKHARGTYPAVVAASVSVWLPPPSSEGQCGTPAEGVDFLPAYTCFNV